MKKSWMIYGANGFTGGLIAAEARRRGHTPILAGRAVDAVTALGKHLGLETRCFGVGSAAAVAPHLDGVQAVLHCAGPFSATARAMLDACLEKGVHYLDVTGEIAVFEEVHRRSAQIAAAGVSAIPGAGFDVVGSDCLAATLKRELPDAVILRMGMYWAGGRMSKGTIKSMTEGAAKGGCIRRNGELTAVSSAYKIMRIPFESDAKRRLAVSIPWGDVSTAYYSTGIPNIEFYWARSAPEIAAMRLMDGMRGIVGHPAVQSFVKAQVERFMRGPNELERSTAEAFIWGEVENAAGKKVALRMRTPEGYTFTYLAALACLERVLQGGVRAGALTPSMAFGPDFALGIPGVRLEGVGGGATLQAAPVGATD